MIAMPIVRDTKVNHMPLDTMATVPFTDMIASWSGLRRICQYLERRRQQVGVPLGLFKSPLSARVFPNGFQVALSCGREPILSHVRGGAYA